ncbi:MAG: hypothetical protein ACRDYX_18010 [Egibacteraceae bacterium]
MADPRERLAARQAALVRALVAGGPVPDGFAPERVRATSEALARKRALQVAKAWPALALNPQFTQRFLSYAVRNPPPGGPLADGLAFAGRLASTEELNGDARVEWLAARSRLRHRRGYRPRRGPFLGAVITGPPRRLVAVVRLPGLGERWVSVPLPSRSARTI